MGSAYTFQFTNPGSEGYSETPFNLQCPDLMFIGENKIIVYPMGEVEIYTDCYANPLKEPYKVSVGMYVELHGKGLVPPVIKLVVEAI